MRTLNLVYPQNSDIKYLIQKFPDGQQNIVLNYIELRHNSVKSVMIESRLNNWEDLELIVASVASLRELGKDEIHLYTPYIVGGRSDRKFEEGGNNYIKNVIAPVINSLNLKSVTTIDPHSDVLEACINNFKKESNKQLVIHAISNLYSNQLKAAGVMYDSLSELNGKFLNNNFILISPDAGASKKIYKLTEELNPLKNCEVITCSKYRDENGKLSKVNVPINLTHLNKDFIIIDDICDGGATFNNIAYQIKLCDTSNSSKIYLIVTHGIFSKGFEELNKYFDGIYCTNSYQDIDVTCVRQLNVF